ncbi:DUF1192 domain-containing protein [Rhizobium sp. S95]|uniref:DUF1192 domain-containing protein n=1 Tax=Ciceribacter sichuanensis TaxID=2949647 RepID=A0AAJ1BYF2_9HYPH|nr:MULTISPECIES: DUF1192 domain-containing protein [unclassified Ciceribacter]MCM2398536.1 DUF1192 domain-containing protein [Ciceribacter sp. S95]MCO5958542.1 DUF1192 domain-containing protein [Ciceribacter sp. S101]
MTFDEERPKKSVTHEIGSDLSSISAEELRARIAVLREEIARIEAEIARKDDSKRAADSFFRPKV